jgi:hypothetical protein
MRIRTVKPGFFSSEDLSSVSETAHLLAAGLLCYADDDGFFNANPALIKAQVFPLRDTSGSIQQMLSELSCIGFIRLGTGCDARRYGHVVKFLEHQRINRPTPSRIKDLQITWDESVSAHGGFSEDSLLEGKGIELKGREEHLTSTAKNALDQPVLIEDVPTVNLDELVQVVWTYFIAAIAKHPKQFKWTPKRRSLGLDRLRDAKDKGGSWENAVELLKLCVERLKSSPWHNGKNPSGKKYLTWEILFRTTEQLEKWLDDDRWADTTGAA